jgi:hypothetical protein
MPNYECDPNWALPIQMAVDAGADRATVIADLQADFTARQLVRSAAWDGHVRRELEVKEAQLQLKEEAAQEAACIAEAERAKRMFKIPSFTPGVGPSLEPQRVIPRYARTCVDNGHYVALHYFCNAQLNRATESALTVDPYHSSIPCGLINTSLTEYHRLRLPQSPYCGSYLLLFVVSSIYTMYI